MKPKVCLLLILTLLTAAQASSQGFYHYYTDVMLAPSSIEKYNISSISATSDYSDSSAHPLSNFIFRFTFDRAHHITSHTRWFSYVKMRDKWIYAYLLKDTFFFENNNLKFRTAESSKTYRLNQYRTASRPYIRRKFERLSRLRPSEDTAYYTFPVPPGSPVNIMPMLEDTILLGKTLHNMLPIAADSSYMKNDTLLLYTRKKTEYFKSFAAYLSATNTICIDSYYEDDLYARYIFDDQGYPAEERYQTVHTVGDITTNGIYTKKYFYNAKGLHIRTEEFQNDQRISYTNIHYTFY